MRFRLLLGRHHAVGEHLHLEDDLRLPAAPRALLHHHPMRGAAMGQAIPARHDSLGRSNVRHAITPTGPPIRIACCIATRIERRDRSLYHSQ